MRKLERVLLKESAGETEEFRALGSLAIAVIDKVPAVKEFIDGIISEAEAIRRRWAFS